MMPTDAATVVGPTLMQGTMVAPAVMMKATRMCFSHDASSGSMLNTASMNCARAMLTTMGYTIMTRRMIATRAASAKGSSNISTKSFEKVPQLEKAAVAIAAGTA